MKSITLQTGPKIPRDRVILRETAHPGERPEEESISNTINDLVSEFDPHCVWRIRSLEAHADYRIGEDGIERRRGNRYRVEVIMERRPRD